MQVKAAVTLGYQQPFVIKDIEVARPARMRYWSKSPPPACVTPTR